MLFSGSSTEARSFIKRLPNCSPLQQLQAHLVSFAHLARIHFIYNFDLSNIKTGANG
jgi:hypothetical protein